MAQANNIVEARPSREELAANARALMRRALKGSLASLEPVSGYPYASLVTLATDACGAPSFLISKLARHTRNLAGDARASVLIDETGGLADPLQGARLTLIGRAAPVADAAVKRRFLARHPEAEFYVSFPDFAFWRLIVESGHYIGGFGRILDFTADELLTRVEGAESLLEAEPGIVTHMNEDHSDAVRLYATRLLGAEDGEWRMTGCDPEGCDLALGERQLRLVFDAPIKTPLEARKALVALVEKARAGA